MNKKEWEIAELFERVVSGSATDEDLVILEQHLMTDREALEIYQDLSRQHAQLQMTDGAGIEAELPVTQRVIPLRWMIASAAAVIVIVLLWAMPSSSVDGSGEPVLAELTAASSAQWGACSLPTSLGSSLNRGQLELLQGTASLTFTSGAVVNLEAPVKVDLLSDMRVMLHYGTALADVPEQAIGFRLDTPDCEVTDLGTSFAVSVDKDSGQARVDVLDGEVELYHGLSEKRKRVVKNQSVGVTPSGMKFEDGMDGELGRSTGSGESSPGLVITTEMGDGGHATVISDHKQTHLYPGLLLVKNSLNGNYARKSYLKFDLRNQPRSKVQNLELVLDQVPSPYGFASFVPDCEFVVYGLLHDKADHWDPEQIDWVDAPANRTESTWKVKQDQVVELGSFTIPKGQQAGVIHFRSEPLNDWVRKDGNGLLSLILVRKTCELRGEGLVHAFAGNRYPDGQPPRLLIEFEQD